MMRYRTIRARRDCSSRTSRCRSTTTSARPRSISSPETRCSRSRSTTGTGSAIRKRIAATGSRTSGCSAPDSSSCGSSPRTSRTASHTPSTRLPSLSQAAAPRDPLRRISMTHTDDPSLSQIELVVLARLSCSKTPTTDDLGKAIIGSDPSIVLPRPIQDVAADTLSALRRRGLVRDKAKKLTDEGARRLRAIFGVSRTPNWSDIQNKHLPAVGLGLQPGTDDARKALRDAGTIGAALLQGELEGELSPTLCAAADALITKLLDLEPGPMTLARIRAQVLAREMRSELKRKPKKKTVVNLVTQHTLGEPLTNRVSIG